MSFLRLSNKGQVDREVPDLNSRHVPLSFIELSACATTVHFSARRVFFFFHKFNIELDVFERAGLGHGVQFQLHQLHQQRLQQGLHVLRMQSHPTGIYHPQCSTE